MLHHLNLRHSVPFAQKMLLLALKIGVQLVDQLVGVGAVNGTGLFDAFTAGCRAADTVHADFKEKLGGVDIAIDDLADQGLPPTPWPPC